MGGKVIWETRSWTQIIGHWGSRKFINSCINGSDVMLGKLMDENLFWNSRLVILSPFISKQYLSFRTGSQNYGNGLGGKLDLTRGSCTIGLG